MIRKLPNRGNTLPTFNVEMVRSLQALKERNGNASPNPPIFLLFFATILRTFRAHPSKGLCSSVWRLGSLFAVGRKMAGAPGQARPAGTFLMFGEFGAKIGVFP